MGLRKVPASLRGVGALLLCMVGYIHFALFLNLFGFRNPIGVLFFLNAGGALVSLIAILGNARWLGWGLGILVAAGAALSKITMFVVPAFSQMLLGVRPKGIGVRGAAHVGHAGGFHAHTVLPLVLPISALANASIGIELGFAVFAIMVLIVYRQPRISRAVGTTS